jgi:serine-type D-Ala-D-Ala carboxypeptidase/endopeptidase (penicillin-binding protein 4)
MSMRYNIALAICLLVCQTAFAAPSKPFSTQKAKRKLDVYLQKRAPNLNVGIFIEDLKTRRILYSHRANKSFIPASSLKLFTTTAALLQLGPAFRYQTQILTDSQKIRAGTLNGNVYLKLSSDPSFSTQAIDKLLSALKNTDGINRINGHFYVILSELVEKPFGPGWMDDDTIYAYGAPVAPLMLNENAFDITVSPGANVTDPTIVTAPSDIKINNESVTQDEKSCRLRYEMSADNVLTIRGCKTRTARATFESIAIGAPWLYLKTVLAERLKANGISLQSSITIAPTHKRKLTTLARHQSDTLGALVHHCLKVSDNLYANAFLLKVGERYYGRHPVTWRQSVSAVMRILRTQLKLNMKHAEFVDGSGLSRFNLIEPTMLVKLLRVMTERFNIKYEFTDALPVSGQYGTLVRIRNPRYQGLIRAKSGSMTGVSSLAGYIQTGNHHLAAFAIMMNGFKGPLSTYRKIQTEILGHFFTKEQLSKAPSSADERHSLRLRAMNRIESQLRRALSEDHLLFKRTPQRLTIYLKQNAIFYKGGGMTGEGNRITRQIARYARTIPLTSMILTQTSTSGRSQQYLPTLQRKLMKAGLQKKRFLLVASKAKLPGDADVAVTIVTSTLASS